LLQPPFVEVGEGEEGLPFSNIVKELSARSEHSPAGTDDPSPIRAEPVEESVVLCGDAEEVGVDLHTANVVSYNVVRADGLNVRKRVGHPKRVVSCGGAAEVLARSNGSIELRCFQSNWCVGYKGLDDGDGRVTERGSRISSHSSSPK